MAIQMRRGEKKDFQPEKLKVGEFAVPTDTGEVYIKTSEDTTKGIATLSQSGKLEQMPNYSDVGAAPASHNHSASNITSGTLPVSRGGTGNSTLENGNILLGNGTGAVNSIEILPISKGGTGSGVASEALTKLGAVPITRTINNKALSANITLTANDVGAASIAQGTKSDTAIQGVKGNGNLLSPDASKIVNVTPTNIGAVPTSRTINNKALSDDISLTSSDIGASAEGHTHTFSSLTSKPTTLSEYGITDAVPSTRTVNNKALSSNISLTASDVSAATAEQGTKADSAIQGVKVNGNLLSPDASKVVNVDATSINAATPEQGAKADSAIQGIQGNGTIITPDTSKIVNITPANIGAAASSHTHSADNITSGTFPISRGGTGATSASAALSNLGVTISSGTWTPTLGSREGTNPTYSVLYRYAMYYRINNLVYVTFHMKVNISNQGSNYACIKGLPFTSTNNMNGQGLAMHEGFGGFSQYPVSANIPDSSSMIYLQNSGGEISQQWRTGDTWIGFSGCYIKA